MLFQWSVVIQPFSGAFLSDTETLILDIKGKLWTSLVCGPEPRPLIKSRLLLKPQLLAIELQTVLLTSARWCRVGAPLWAAPACTWIHPFCWFSVLLCCPACKSTLLPPSGSTNVFSCAADLICKWAELKHCRDQGLNVGFYHGKWPCTGSSFGCSGLKSRISGTGMCLGWFRITWVRCSGWWPEEPLWISFFGTQFSHPTRIPKGKGLLMLTGTFCRAA